MVDAIGQSWSAVAGGNWWRAFAITTAIETPCILIPAIVRIVVIRNSVLPLDTGTIAALATLAALCLIVGQMWASGSILALATTLRR